MLSENRITKKEEYAPPGNGTNGIRYERPAINILFCYPGLQTLLFIHIFPIEMNPDKPELYFFLYPVFTII